MVADRLQRSDVLLLLLRIRADYSTASDLSDIAGDLETLASTLARQARFRIVVAWYVDDAVRRDLALPEDEPGHFWNATSLLIGTAWQNELAAHDDDTGAAADCRSRRVRRLLDAVNNQTVGNAEPAALHRNIERLDPGFLVALCTQLPSTHLPTGTADGAWADEASVIAAVERRHSL
ncbi:MAG: hypothetical protein AB7L91_18080 [Dehalococcoidia bacterium]